jgi:hypothetical protein
MKKSLTLWIRLRNLGYLLVHPIAGLFVNNPIAIIALVGLFIGIRQRRSEAVLAMACIVTVLLSLSYVGYIYPGRAFGQRLLVHLYIFLLIGIYIFIKSFPVPGIILTTAFVIWSFILMNLYFVSTSQKEVRLPEVRGFNPIVMIEAAAQARKSSGLSLPKLWYRSISTGPYPTLHVILLRTQQPEIQNTDPGL